VFSFQPEVTTRRVQHSNARRLGRILIADCSSFLPRLEMAASIFPRFSAVVK